MHRRTAFLAVLLCVVGPAITALADGAPERAAWKAEYHRPKAIPLPPDNPYSDAKASLGRTLFFDPIFSGSGTRSCASCHSPGLSWGDGLPRAVGANQPAMALRSPTLLNIAWIPLLGWDGKFADLESVAFAPILAPGNMNRKEDELLAALSAIPHYRRAFAEAFPGGGVTRPNIEIALATLQRTIGSRSAALDCLIA